MPVCHYCHRNNLFTDVDVFKVEEDIARPSFRIQTIKGTKIKGKAHRICNECLDKYEEKHKVSLTILKEYHSKTNLVAISQRKFLKRKEYEARRLLR